MPANSIQNLFSYKSLNECENTLTLAYAIREVLTSASFKSDARIKASITIKQLDKEIAAAEAYWQANGGEA